VCVRVWRLLGWRRVSTAVDFRWLPCTTHQGGSDPHKVTRFPLNTTEVIRVFPPSTYRTTLARVYFSPLCNPLHRIYTRVLFLSPRTRTYVCARALANIYCVSTCVHTIFQIHLWHVFFPCFPPGSDPYFDPVDRIVFNGSLSTHTRAQPNFDGR